MEYDFSVSPKSKLPRTWEEIPEFERMVWVLTCFDAYMTEDGED